MQVTRQPGSFWTTAGFGLVAAPLFIAVSRASWAGVLCAALYLSTAVALGYWQSQRHREAHEQIAGGPADRGSRLRELCLHVLPAWGQQIDTSRNTADEAVTRLAKTFAAMVERLNIALAASRSAVAEIVGREGSIVDVVRSSESNLENVLATLKGLQHRKESILGQTIEFAKHLQEMAAEVQSIAFQTKLISINGAIEAARASDGGRAFAVVVGEMHRLATESAALGANISSKAKTVDAIVTTLLRDADASSGTEVTLIQRAESDLGGVMASFKGLTSGLARSVRTMEQETETLKEQIADALVELQFQDRISQMLAHTVQSLEAVRAAVTRDGEAATDVETALEDMSHAFTTHAEFAELRGMGGGERTGHEVRFFEERPNGKESHGRG